MRIILSSLFLIFILLPKANSQSDSDSLIFTNIKYAFGNYNILDYYQISDDFKVLQLAPGEDRIFVEDVVTLIHGREALVKDTLEVEGFLRYVVPTGKNKFSISTGKTCVVVSVEDGRIEILKTIKNSKKVNIGAIFDEGILYYDPKAYRRSKISWMFKYNNGNEVELISSKKLKNWDDMKYPASGSTHERFIYYDNKIILNSSIDDHITVFDISSGEIFNKPIPKDDEYGIHIVQDFKNLQPYLIKYQYTSDDNVELYKLFDFDMNNPFLVGKLDGLYPFSIYDKTFFSWTMFEGQMAIYKRKFNW
jgi:hypothetical protein